MQLKHTITKKLGTPDSVILFTDKCLEGEHDFENRFAHRITTQYQIIDTEQYQVVQSTYCYHQGCHSRQDKIWNIDKPFNYNTNPP